ncbi:DUF6266 family protein [Olivibacter domesticus]|uniref:Uncharacterized protein n=1 Tax=Olivibacter domesticus TaxID=407022 RepID=A0A1H7KHF1_OLID1|nr:DUF6266 family protein [Olivibacter domesticus]SEK86281.1 hypothetical protein SAMN05661044_01356 [Olivibacter domesticus]
MAKFVNGAIGTFSGKVGSVIGSSWRSIHYMRGLSKKRTKPFTEGQLAQQRRFGMMGRFLLPLRGLMEIGFANLDTSRATLLNLVMARNLPAVTGEYPDFSIDYAKIAFSNGSLLQPRNVTVGIAPGVATVSWNPATNKYNGHADDEMYPLLYDHELNLFYTSDDIVLRSDGEAEIPLDADTAGHMADVWLFSTSRDGKLISETVHAGSHTLA